MKFNLIVADPPWFFFDSLKGSVKRGAASQYDVLNIDDIKALDVKSLTEDNCVLALWVPSSLLQDGLDTMSSWGFTQKQTFIWVKTKKEPLKLLKKKIKKSLLLGKETKTFNPKFIKKVLASMDEFDCDDILSFYMGRLFRQTHEICLIGTRGKVYPNLKNKSQRSVSNHFSVKHPGKAKHSGKPEALQDRLDIMFPNAHNKLELFARRVRADWRCVGLESPDTLGEDIRDAIERLKKE